MTNENATPRGPQDIDYGRFFSLHSGLWSHVRDQVKTCGAWPNALIQADWIYIRAEFDMGNPIESAESLAARWGKPVDGVRAMLAVLPLRARQ